MFGKILRGVFGQPKDLPAQFSGDSYEAFVDFLERSCPHQVFIGSGFVELQAKDRKPVKITRSGNKSFLVEYETQGLDTDLTDVDYFDPFFAVVRVGEKS